MKAIRKSDKCVIEVEPRPVYSMKSDKVHYKCLTDGNHYSIDDLDFEVSKFYTEETIHGWVARNMDGCLSLFDADSKPSRMNMASEDYPPNRWGPILGKKQLPQNLFPDLTWQDEPIAVRIVIKPI